MDEKWGNVDDDETNIIHFVSGEKSFVTTKSGHKDCKLFSGPFSDKN